MWQYFDLCGMWRLTGDVVQVESFKPLLPFLRRRFSLRPKFKDVAQVFLHLSLWQYNWSIWLHLQWIWRIHTNGQIEFAQHFKFQLRLHAALRRRGLMERASEVGLEIYIIRWEAIVVAHLRWAGWVCTTGGGTTATTSTSCTTSPCLDQTSSYVPCSIFAKNYLDW